MGSEHWLSETREEKDYTWIYSFFMGIWGANDAIDFDSEHR